MSNFSKSIKRAEEQGWLAGARRMRMERSMASGLVKACLKRGFTVTVDNGEDRPIKKSTSYRAIMNELWQTDEERVIIYDAVDGKCRGWFFLVYGNDGYDLISDYSATAVCEAIWDEVLSPLGDRLEAGR